MKNLGNLMKQAQQMQTRMEEMQRKLLDLVAEGMAGGGLVKVTLNGKNEMKAIKIDPSLLDPKEVEVLEDLIVAATNDARAKVEAEAAREMQSVTGGLNLPPGMKLPF